MSPDSATMRAAAGKDGGALLNGIAVWLEGSGSFIEFSGSGSSIRRSLSAAAYVAERSSAYGPYTAPAASRGLPRHRNGWA